MKWYLPTFHGDIQLTAKAKDLTELRAYELTPDEEVALRKLRERACDPGWGREPWADERDFVRLSSAVYRTKEGLTVNLRASIHDVQKVLAASLKPNRQLLSVVRFSDGRFEEITEANAERLTAESKVSSDTASESKSAESKVSSDTASESKVSKSAESKPEKAAATVAEPVIGCPQPVFPEADIRASRVLEAFLTHSQYLDYRQHGAFVATGHDTGMRYMITNREAPGTVKAQARWGSTRSLYCLDEGLPLCVHDWDVPPPEEMLALLLCLSVPGRESYVRSLPETFH